VKVPRLGHSPPGAHGTRDHVRGPSPPPSPSSPFTFSEHQAPHHLPFQASPGRGQMLLAEGQRAQLHILLHPPQRQRLPPHPPLLPFLPFPLVLRIVAGRPVLFPGCQGSCLPQEGGRGRGSGGGRAFFPPKGELQQLLEGRDTTHVLRKPGGGGRRGRAGGREGGKGRVEGQLLNHGEVVLRPIVPDRSSLHTGAEASGPFVNGDGLGGRR
jgi:hypothetical protein